MQRRPQAIPVIPLPSEADSSAVPGRQYFRWIVIAVAALGFSSMLILPSASAWVLESAISNATAAKTAVDVGARTESFFLAVFGAWGFVLYLWACCVYSAGKGRSWTLGLLALPGLISFIFLLVTGWPAMGLLGVLGIGGFLVPFLLPADDLLIASELQSSFTGTLVNRMAWFWALGLFIGVSVAYGNSFRGEMTLDNRYIIQEYYQSLPGVVQNVDLFSWTNMVPLFFKEDYWWPKGISGLYRPVAVFSFWANYALNNAQGLPPLDTFQYHVVNLFLHWIVACLGFILIRQLSGRTGLAFFSALLFCTHPIATESVSNIIGRSDIFAAIAVFGTLSLYIRSRRTASWSLVSWLALFITAEAILVLCLIGASYITPPTWLEVLLICAVFIVPVAGGIATVGAWQFKWTRFPWLAAAMAVLVVGLFSKESAIAVVGMIVAYDAIYLWTLEDLRFSIPSLLLFSVMSALGAIGCLWVGQLGALGLSEGLKPVLIILVVVSLLTSAGLVVALIYWTLSKPLSLKQVGEPWTKFFIPYIFVAIPPTLLWLCARHWVFANTSPPETPFLDNPIRGLGFLAARMTASDVFIRLIALLVWPVHLSCDYSFNQIPLFGVKVISAETCLAFLGLMVLLGLIALMALCYKRNKLLCFLIAFYLIAYLPTSNYVIIIGSIMAERFLYLPLIAFVTCLVLGVEAISKRLVGNSEKGISSFGMRSAIVCALLAVLAGAYAIRDRYRNDDWMSDITLWTAAKKISPMSFRCYQSLAYALYEQFNQRMRDGVYASNTALRDADIDACFETAQGAKPIVDPLPAKQNSSRLYLHLGMYYTIKAQTIGHFLPNGTVPPGDGSENWFRSAEQVLQQGVVVDRVFNGINRDKEVARGMRHSDEVADVGLPPIYYELGNVYSHLGEWKKAIQSFQYMQHLDPTAEDAYTGLANCYLNENRFDAASATLFQVIILDGKRPKIWETLAQTLSHVNPTDKPALVSSGGKIQINVAIPEVRSVLCSTYQNFVQICLFAKRPEMAKQFAATAVHDWKFPPELFEEKPDENDVPVPPQPD